MGDVASSFFYRLPSLKDDGLEAQFECLEGGKKACGSCSHYDDRGPVVAILIIAVVVG